MKTYLLLITLAILAIIGGLFVSNKNTTKLTSLNPTLTTGEAGFNDIVIQARGTNGKEKIALYINNTPVQFWNLTNNFQDYIYTPNEEITVQELSIHFLNDTWEPENNINYDVQIPYITVNGTKYNSEHNSTVSTGSWDQDAWCAPGNKKTQWLNCNGSFTYNIPVGTVVGLPQESGSDFAFTNQPEVQEITETAVKISFSTSEKSQARTYIGTSSNPSEIAAREDSFLHNSHNQRVVNLLADTMYYYKVVSINENAEQITSEVGSFRTKVTENPITDSQIITPNPSATLTGSSQKFVWSDGNNPNRFYDLHIGSTKGGRDHYDLIGNGVYAQEEITATGLPTNGSTVYVKLLWSDDQWATNSFSEYEYTADGEPVKPPSGDVINEANILKNAFSDESVGVYSDAKWKTDTDWGDVGWANFYNRSSVVQNDRGKELRIKFPANVYGHRNGGGSAGIYFTPQDEVYQRMTVMFEPGYDFRISGKIGGLGSPGGVYSGGNVPTKGEGYTSRFIWDSRDGNTNGNRAAIYLYHMDQRSKWGDQDGLGFTWKTGVYYTLTQRIKRNTGSSRNGILQIWVSENGGPQRLVMSRSDMRWGLNGKGKANTLMVNPFHGGSGQQYAPLRDSYMRLDNFAISTKKFSDLP